MRERKIEGGECSLSLMNTNSDASRQVAKLAKKTPQKPLPLRLCEVYPVRRVNVRNLSFPHIPFLLCTDRHFSAPHFSVLSPL